MVQVGRRLGNTLTRAELQYNIIGHGQGCVRALYSIKYSACVQFWCVYVHVHGGFLITCVAPVPNWLLLYGWVVHKYCNRNSAPALPPLGLL